tara:strand:+ start:206 stop:724 length:519 start_codon:yes stop_codon:yes gene_type:complete
MPRVRYSQTKGLYQDGADGGKGIVGTTLYQNGRLVASSDATEYITSGDEGITQPAKSVLIGATVMVTTELAYADSNVGLRIGTAAGGAQCMTLDADSLVASTSTSLAAGKGTSTHGHVATSLGGQATAVIVADSGYSATERTLYPEVVCDGGSITAGVLQVFLEFLQFDTDV